MAFNLDRFRSNIKNLTRGQHFEMRITKPPTASRARAAFNAQGFGQDFTFLAKKASLPGQQIQTQDSNIEYGPLKKMGFQKIYADLDCDFIMEDTFKAKEFFDLWQEEIVGTPQTANQIDYTEFDQRWYDDYVGEFVIIQYSPSGRPIYKTTVYEAFPVAVSNLDLDWEQRDQYQLLNVQFAYRWHKNESLRG